MPLEMDEPAAFRNVADLDRTARAVRWVERLMLNPANEYIPLDSVTETAIVKVTGSRRSDGFYLGLIYYKNPWYGSTTSTSSTTSTTTTSTTTTSTTTTCRPVTTTTSTSTTSTTTTSTTTTNPPNEQFVTYGEKCLVIDVNLRNLGFGCFYEGPVQPDYDNYTIVLVTNDANPVVDCETTTTTTLAPCPGECLWDYDYATCKWTLTSNCCQTADCECEEPAFCPEPSDCPTVETRTRCYRGKYSIEKVCDCEGTTTTTTTTTVPPGEECHPCDEDCLATTTTTTTTMAPECIGCTWNYTPKLGWVFDAENSACGEGCASEPCGSSPPDTPDDPNSCATVTYSCAGTTPPPPCGPDNCGGHYYYVCDGDGSWRRYAGGCSSTCDGGCTGEYNCSHTPPDPRQNCGECGGLLKVKCFSTCSEPTTTLCPEGSTTTTPAPDCGGDCFWEWDAGTSTWTFKGSTCFPLGDCACYPPNFDGRTDCEQAITPCQDGTTTTTTTTTSTTTTTTTTTTSTTTTTTTTTAMPLKWFCSEIISSQGGPCASVGTKFCEQLDGAMAIGTVLLISCGGGFVAYREVKAGPFDTSELCMADCVTTTTTSTTTTTTTTTPEPQDYYCYEVQSVFGTGCLSIGDRFCELLTASEADPLKEFTNRCDTGYLFADLISGPHGGDPNCGSCLTTTTTSTTTTTTTTTLPPGSWWCCGGFVCTETFTEGCTGPYTSEVNCIGACVESPP